MINYDDSTLDDARDALHHIDAHDREIWVLMGMAIKAEFGDNGFDVWDNWSGSAGNYEQKAARNTWKSFKKSGGVGIATLFRTAVDNGYQRERPQRPPEELDALRVAREARAKTRDLELEQDAVRVAALHDLVAVRSNEIWKMLSDTGHSDYLKVKGVGAYDVRFFTAGMVVVTDVERVTVQIITGRQGIADFFGRADKESLSFKYFKSGTLSVPVRDASGRLHSLQIIYASGRKTYLKGGRKKGLFHLLGDDSPRTPLAVAEGYATAATVHQATGWPCAVAFDAGNLVPVASALREKWPDRDLIVCGDDDTKTEGNPGRAKATQAARAVGARVVFPVFEKNQKIEDAG